MVNFRCMAEREKDQTRVPAARWAFVAAQTQKLGEECRPPKLLSTAM